MTEATAGDTATATLSRKDRWYRTVAGGLAAVAGLLYTISATLPWSSTMRVRGHPARTVDLYPGGYFVWVLLGAGAALIATALVCTYTIHRAVVRRAPDLRYGRPNVCMPFIPTAIVAMVVADQWSGALQAHPGTGFAVGIAGIAFGVLATIALIPAEHQVARPPRLARPTARVDSPAVPRP